MTTPPNINDYQDILHCSRPQYPKPMSIADRAAQFSPYAALTGHQDIISADEAIAEHTIDHEHEIITYDEI